MIFKCSIDGVSFDYDKDRNTVTLEKAEGGDKPTIILSMDELGNLVPLFNIALGIHYARRR